LFSDEISGNSFKFRRFVRNRRKLRKI
jgi:hypothetical protein